MASNKKKAKKKKQSNNKPDSDSGQWATCPECGTEVRPQNLESHLKKVHPKAKPDDNKSLMMARRRKMGMVLAAVLVVIVVVTASMIIFEPPPSRIDDPIEAAEVGDKAPLFTLKDTLDTSYKLSDYANQTPVILEFAKPATDEYWDMWDILSNFHSTYGNNLTIFTVIPETQDSISQSIAWPTLVATPDILAAYGVSSYPTLVIVDINGTIMYRGVTGLTLEALSPRVELAVKGYIEEPAIEVGPNVGNIAPDFKVWDIYVENQTLDGYLELGKPVYLEFFDVSCSACQKMTTTLREVDEIYGSEITIVSISTNSYAAVMDFIWRYNTTWTMLWGEGASEAFSAYKVQPIPLSFIIDTDGIIRYKHLGSDVFLADLVAPIESVI